MVLADSHRASPTPRYSGYCSLQKNFDYGAVTLYGSPSQVIQLDFLLLNAVLQPHLCRNICGLGFFPFARRYLGNHYYFLFLRLLRCFSSAGWLSFEWHIFNMPGCPIRRSSDITLVCSSPKLIAAYHVLLRLSDPRHPPCALNCFKKFTNCVILLSPY